MRQTGARPRTAQSSNVLLTTGNCVHLSLGGKLKSFTHWNQVQQSKSLNSNKSRVAKHQDSRQRSNSFSLNNRRCHILAGTMRHLRSARRSVLVVLLALLSVASLAASVVADLKTGPAANQSDLIAIGAVALLRPDGRQQQHQPPLTSDRLVDRIASPETPTRRQKLDFIMDFMRANRLVGFCDLLASEQPEVRDLRRRLNSMGQFTLFVPTDEALLLMQPASQLERLRRSGPEARDFLMSHLSGELVVPEPATALDNWPGRSALIMSLGGAPLRLARLSPAHTRPVELLVNGASILLGQSHVLQEPNRTSQVHAVLHLVDRPLWPAVRQNLRERLRRHAPRMAQLVERAADERVDAYLDTLPLISWPPGNANSLDTNSTQLVTLFAPTDEAFRALPSKLMSELESNRTNLVEFVRAHILRGLWFGAQLKPSEQQLASISGRPLRFETKTLQARTVPLVNSVPVVETDALATNGILHLLARPMLDRRLLDECRCGQSADLAIDLNDSTVYERLWPAASSIQTSSELERENHSSGPQAAKLRAQRQSNGLVARNNHDFYRPSSAPANLLLSNGQPHQQQHHQQQSANQRVPELGLAASIQASDRQPSAALIMSNQLAQQQQQSASNPFDADSYKVVLNATTRQRLREQQATVEPAKPLQFAYDRPSGELSNARRQPLVKQPAANSNADQLAIASSLQRPMLKFRPEEARDGRVEPGMRLFQSNRSARLMQPAYDILANTPAPQLAAKTTAFAGADNQSGKTLAPAACAFYDADCKRLLASSKLVRLPPVSLGRQQHKSAGLLLSSSSQRANLTSSGASQTPAANHNGQQHQQHFDSTFGETTLRPTSPMGLPAALDLQQVPTRTPLINSPLSQPLPPWTDAERLRSNSQLVGATNWRANDLNRLQPSVSSNLSEPIGFAPGLSRSAMSQTTSQLQLLDLPNHPQHQQQSHVLLVPVELLPVSQQAPASLRPTRPFASSSQLNFHSPTPISVHAGTTHVPPMFMGRPDSSLGRLTNFSALEPSVDQAERPPRWQANSFRGPTSVLDGPFGQHPEQSKVIEHANGDISITSARLSNSLPNLLASSSSQMASGHSAGSGLAALASNPAPEELASGQQFTRSVINSNSLELEDQSASSSDFFQNRTISEIMDDSGLQIDGQQVTFGRLKECLEEADLASVLSQPASSLTIFMPTDSAYERLVQQQASVHHKLATDSNSRSTSSTSARLTDPARRQLLPLVTRQRADRLTGTSNLSNNPSTSSGKLELLGDRLTLDCASPQVRQLLLDHLSASFMSPRQLQTDMGLSSLGGRKLLVSTVPSKKIVVVDGQPVIAATRAKNGMVYVVNKFLNLSQQVPNVLDLVESQPNLTTFLSYLTFSGLAERLRRETGPLTVLAPTNEAFEQLSSSARQLINSDPVALMDIMRGHIVEGAQFGKLIPMRNRLKTMNADQFIEAKVIKPNVYSLDSQMTPIRLVGTSGNGVVNSIDRLIVPAWLKLPAGSSGTSSTANPPSDPLRFATGELSPPAARPRQPSSGNLLARLPIGQPVTFDRALGGTVSDSSSFLFAGNSIEAAEPPLASANASNWSNGPLLRLNNTSDNKLAGTWRPTDDQAARLRPNISRNLQLIEKLGNLLKVNKFVTYLKASRIGSSLKPDMSYVILAPTDQAIEKLPKQIIDMLERDPERLTDLIGYHVLDTTFEYINTIPDGQTMNSLNEKDILFNWHRNSTILTASGAVVLGGIQEDNIALLMVDRVLYPTPGDLLSIVSKSPILSNFTSILRSAGLEKQLALAGPFTLFAPSDFAFNQLERRDIQVLQRDREYARRFLLRHLSQPAVFSSSITLSSNSSLPATGSGQQTSSTLVPTMTVTNLLGEDLVLRQRNEFYSVNDVNFSYADVAATNGIVHVIDGLL